MHIQSHLFSETFHELPVVFPTDWLARAEMLPLKNGIFLFNSNTEGHLQEPGRRRGGVGTMHRASDFQLMPT